MCGFVLIIDKKNNIHDDTLLAMTATLTHRGPDGDGYVIFSKDKAQQNPNITYPQHKHDTSLGFGHRRLSIYDTSAAGNQPMQYQHYWIVFNGAIFNFIELKKELITAGYTFQTKTDTEVIIAAYDYWGEKCLSKFNGMWSCIIYDTQKQHIFIARDRFAIKPLYYYQDENSILFASEIKALLKHPKIKTSPNMSYIDSFLKSGAKEYLKETAFSNIMRFTEASYLEIPLDKILAKPIIETPFWNLKQNPNKAIKTLDEYAEDYLYLLHDAVKLRLRADVDVGSALSGGLDSSSIVYFIEQEMKKKQTKHLQQTFSCVYQSSDSVKNCDESYYINSIAKYLGVKSNQIEPNVDELINEYEKMIYHLGTPPDNTLMSSWYTYKCVNQTPVKVTLDGQGADEQQAGYLSYLINFQAFNPLLSLPKQILNFKNIPNSIPRLILGSNCSILNKTKLNQLPLLADSTQLKKWSQPLHQRLHHDTLTQLKTLLHYADHTSMAFHIESRMPFMDYRLVEFTHTLPDKFKIQNGWTKYFARYAMKDKLPKSICWRSDKMGWPIPEKPWFKGPLNKWLIHKIESSSFLKEHNLNQTIKHQLNQSKNIAPCIKLLNLASWYDCFF